MTKDHPDFLDPAGRNVGGGTIDSFSFTGAIASGATGVVDAGEVATGKEKFYQGLTISVPDDTAIHTVVLTRINDGFVWWSQEFITAGNFDISGFAFGAGKEVRISITNNASASLTFTGQIFATERDVT